MKRRDFLRTMAQAAAAVGAFSLEHPLRFGLRQAHAATGKTLIVIFQRGGCDGLNSVVPYGDSAYYEQLRPTIGVAPSLESGIQLPSGLLNNTPALHIDSLFGLHPGLQPLHELYLQGDVAVLPTVHYPNASFSHFDGQHFIESSASDADRNDKENLDGWLNRYLRNLMQDSLGQLPAVSFGSSLAQSLRGEVSVSSFQNLRNFSLGLPEAEENALVDRLLGLYNAAPAVDSYNRQLVHWAGRVVFNSLDVVRSLDPDYQPDPAADYPPGGYGDQLKQAAQLIKEGVGLEVASVNIGGWDTHSDQGGGDPNGWHGRRLNEFARGIKALYDDLGTLMNDVVILTMTEFGRTARENGSLGTDHGNAASWFVVSPSVSGGVYLDYADGIDPQGWPGLSEDLLYHGRYLRQTIDYRDVMGEILGRFVPAVALPAGSAALSDILRGHSYRPIGFLPG